MGGEDDGRVTCLAMDAATAGEGLQCNSRFVLWSREQTGSA